MERLWSYLRRFTRMTKEMRPSHRTDILTSALVYYGIQTKEKLRKSSFFSPISPLCMVSHMDVNTHYVILTKITYMYLSFFTPCPMGPSS